MCSKFKNVCFFPLLLRVLGEDQNSFGARPQDKIQPRVCERTPSLTFERVVVSKPKSMQPIVGTPISPISMSKGSFTLQSVHRNPLSEGEDE